MAGSHSRPAGGDLCLGTDRALALHGVVPQMRTDDVPGWPQRRTDDVVTAGTDLPGLKGTGWLESDARTP